MDRPPIKFNPAFLSEEELVRSFVVRQTDLDLIVQTIRENVTDGNQHVLVTGPRGIGKTTLVLRVAAEVRRDPALSEKWYPLVFAEESYRVETPGEFWLEALFHLGQQTKSDRWKRVYDELKGERDEQRLHDRALAQLMDFADQEGKRILLIVENLNMLLGEQISETDAWTLRHTLLNEPRVMLLATATTRLEEIADAGSAFFELLKPHALRWLDEAECRALWSMVTGEEPADHRIRPIQILTGGNPRLVAIVASLGARLCFSELMDDLMRLIDDNTEYFKSHLDRLPPAERKVYLSLAELWRPATAREVAAGARLDVSKTSALLNRLVGRGAVTAADAQGRTKWYQVAERMYNIYYLMRRRGAPSSRVKAVVNFMVGFYGPKELVSAVQRLAEEACGLKPEERGLHHAAYRGLLEELSDPALRQTLIEQTPRDFLEASDIPELLKETVRKGTEATGKGTTEDTRAVDLLKRACEAAKQPDQIGEAVSLCEEATRIAPRNPIAWTLLGMLLHYDLQRFDEAEEAYRKVVELKPDFFLLWETLGLLLHYELGRFDEAEEAYRKAIELEPHYSQSWRNLGTLLQYELGRFDEAEEAYRKAIKLEPDNMWAWAQLGMLLQEDLECPVEAEAAYRKAIELEPNHAVIWGSLGMLLHHDLGRFEEAEAAYLKATELDRDYAIAWGSFAGLLHYELGRFEEAEGAYRKALELAPDDAVAWGGLAVLSDEHLGRTAEFLALVDKAVAEHAGNAEVLNAVAWGLYRSGVSACLDKAEACARQAVALASERSRFQHTLGCLLVALGRAEEAIEPAKEVVKDADAVKTNVLQFVDLFVALAAAGCARPALDVLERSACAEALEPLIVGLKLHLGEDVKTAAEILEVGRDVAERIRQRAAHDAGVPEQAVNDRQEDEGEKKER